MPSKDGFRVSGFSFWEFRVSDFGFRVSGFGFLFFNFWGDFPEISGKRVLFFGFWENSGEGRHQRRAVPSEEAETSASPPLGSRV